MDRFPSQAPASLPTTVDLASLPAAVPGARFTQIEDLSRALDTIPARLSILDRTFRYRFVNRHYEEFTGLSLNELLGRTVEEVFGSDTMRTLKPLFERALTGQTVFSEGWMDYPSRGRRYARRTLTPNPAADGSIDSLFMFIQDLTDLRVAEEALRASQSLNLAVIEGALDSIMVLDERGAIVEFNPAAERTFGRQHDQVLGHSIDELVLPQRAGSKSAFCDLIANSQPLAETRTGTGTDSVLGQRTEVEGLRADGSQFSAELGLTVVTVENRPLFLAFLHDISDHKRFEQSLADLAYRDSLTGLPNRLSLMRDIGEAIGSGCQFAIVNVDIDRFANIRNSFGHAFVDDLLVGVAGRLIADVGLTGMVARVGDHSFALLLAKVDDEDEIKRRLDAVLATIRAAVTPSGVPVYLTASIGIARYSPEHKRPEDALRDAEIAAGRAREAGGSRAVWFDPAMHGRMVDLVRTEHDLRLALALANRGVKPQLWVAYQPIVELITGRLAGFEALIRWNHPERGNIGPIEFVPVAEETGLIVAMDRWVLHEACQQLGRWQGMREPGAAALFLSLNLSPRQIEEPDFLAYLQAVLRETGTDPAWIKMEITESAVMRRPEESINTLRSLKELGIRLSIDDFGTGYSSLSYLYKLPLDAIKIDRSFISVMHQSEENRSIVRLIVDLARLLGFNVVAEGIESVADVILLRALACDYGQGYLFAKPLAPAEAEALVSRPPGWLDTVWPQLTTGAEEEV
ncbi:diguanylate cyclase [uncultured Gammaproteobacteria bacterium]